VLDCRQFLGELGDYLDGTEEPGACVEMERHLQVCRKCRIVCETTRRTVMLYKSRYAGCSVPPEVEARLMAAIRKRMS
jgi:predicted anti-sigma-YlaC factor YlaD